MAERLTITAEEANALFAPAREESTMTEADKIRFREERDAFALSGGVEGATEPKPVDIALLTEKDIPEIEAAVQTKITELMVKVSREVADPVEMNRVFSRVYTLRKRNLIGNEVYGEAEAFFGQQPPITERSRG